LDIKKLKKKPTFFFSAKYLKRITYFVCNPKSKLHTLYVIFFPPVSRVRKKKKILVLTRKKSKNTLYIPKTFPDGYLQKKNTLLDFFKSLSSAIAKTFEYKENQKVFFFFKNQLCESFQNVQCIFGFFSR
jgi:hypothetical protein